MKKYLVPVVLAAFFAAVILVLRIQLSDGQRFRPGTGTITGLALTPDGHFTRLGKAWKTMQNGNILIALEGSPYEMGFQHGRLLRDEIRSGVVPIFADPISHSPEHKNKPAALRWLMLKYLEIAVFRPIEKNTPREYLEEIAGLADGAGMQYRDVFIANFKSDLSMAMAPKMIAKTFKNYGIVMECSDFAADATPDGNLVVGRNTDYTGQGRWMKHQTVFIRKPAGAHSYVHIETAGILKCNSAMNEKGITVGGHFMAFEGAVPSGWSFTVFEHEIMRRASSVEEALAILKNRPRGGAFSLMIADGKNRKAVAVEATLDRMGVRFMTNGALRVTNYALSPEMQPVDIVARNNMIMRDMAGRYRRLGELIEKHRGRITPGVAASIMGDHYDVAVKKERGTGITIGAANNVTSAVFLPGRLLFWVGTGVEPACNNTFLGYDFRALLKGKTIPPVPARLPGYRWQDPRNERGLRAYMKAYQAYEENPDDPTVMAHLERAMRETPDEPVYPRMAARLLLKKGKSEQALSLLDASLKHSQSNNERALTHLHRGQALDLLGRRSEAVTAYGEVLKMKERHGKDYITGINSLTAGLAKRFAEKPFTVKDMGMVQIGFHQETGLE